MKVLSVVYLVMDLLSVGFFLIGFLSNNILTLLVSLVLLVISNSIYSFTNIKENILFFCFNGTYFIFLVGRLFVSTFFNYKIDYRGLNGLDFNNPEIIVTTLIALFLSLISVRIGYMIFRNYNFNFLKSTRQKANDKGLQISSLVLFYISIIFRLYIVFEMRQATVSEGYFETFSQFKSSLPTILQTFGDMYDMFFFAFLATLPTKKKSLLPTFLYILEGVIAASSGRRSVLMLNVLIVVIYFIIRNNKEKNDIWFGKKEVVISLISLPILMTMMTIIGSMRASSSINKSNSLLDYIYEFLYSQGVSANLIGYTEIYKNQMPNHFYSLGPIYEFISESIIKPIQGVPSFFGQTAERALNGHLFSQTLPYFIDRRAYLSGYGWGSSIVAENYFDGGFIGVVIGGFIYGLILIFLIKVISKGGFLFMTFGLAMARIILFSPRGAYLSFLVSSMSPRKIAAVLLVIISAWFVNQFFYKNKSFEI